MADPNRALAIWRSLRLADSAISSRLNTELNEKAGCSLLEHDLMAWLAAAPRQRLQMRDLADRLRITPGGLTRIVDRLVARGWVHRDAPAHNRREVHAVLTSEGIAALDAARLVYTQVVEDAFTRHLDTGDLDRLTHITDTLLHRLDISPPG